MPSVNVRFKSPLYGADETLFWSGAVMSVQLFDCDSFRERESDRKGNRSRLRMHHTYYNWPLTHCECINYTASFPRFRSTKVMYLSLHKALCTTCTRVKVSNLLS